jgi:hypothetical protein
MKLSPNFTLAEFVESDTADRLCIDNDLPGELLGNAYVTAKMLEAIRAYLSMLKGVEVPINITSGYRCAALNTAIGSTGKDHPQMMAADFNAPAFGIPLAVCQTLVPVMDELGIGQLIYEHTWVHVSTRTPDKLINRIITVAGKDYVAGIVA